MLSDLKGRRLRTGYEFSWSGGPLRFAGEYMRVRDERRQQGLRGEDLPALESEGWFASGSWRVFGERRDSRLPKRFAPLSGQVGAIDVAVRAEGLRFWSDAPGEPEFRNPRAAHVLGNADRALTLGLNWSFSRFGRLQCDAIAERVSDAERSPVGSTNRFWSVITRLQLHL